MVVLWKKNTIFSRKTMGKWWFLKYRKHENLMVEGQRDPLVIMAVENNH